VCWARKMIQNYRHFLELQLPCGKKTAVAGDDASIAIDWNVKPKGRDAGGDLRDLCVRTRFADSGRKVFRQTI
jgi:hypothetical protein